MNRFAMLMAGTALGFVPMSLCSIEGEDTGGGGGGTAVGGAAEALAGGGTTTDTTTADTTTATTTTDTTGGGADPAFLELFSAEGGDADNPSARDYIKGLGVKDPNHLAQLLRENQKAARAGGIKVPGEGAKPEEIAAYHKAIGVPDKIEGYEVALPEGVTEDMLDQNLLPLVREAALKSGTPAGAFKAMAGGYIKAQLDQMQADRTAEDTDHGAKMKEWGPNADAKMADVQNAMRTLGVTPRDFQAMQRGFQVEYREPGSGKLLELFAKLGGGMAEASFIDGEKRRFGISGAEAQNEVNKAIVDPEFQKKLTEKDPTTVARWDRWNAAIAAERDRQEAAAARA